MAITGSSNPVQTPYVSPVRAPLTALVTLVATLGIVGCGSSGAPPTGDPNASVTSPGTTPATLKSSKDALRTIEALRAHFQVPPAKTLPDRLSPRHPALPALLPPGASHPKPHPLLAPAPARSYNLIGNWLRPVLPEGIRAGVLKPAKVRLGATATEVARVQDESTGAAITVQWLDARDNVKGSFAKGYVVYDGVKGPGTTALTRADIRGAEQYVKVTSEGHGELHYRVKLDNNIAGLRQVKGTQALEFLDEKGAPRLRMTAPVALAGTEKVALKLRVLDCAVDTSPRAPWGRAVTAPGQRACEVVVSWDGGQGRELLVDPAWTTTGNMAQGRRSHTASLLSSGKVLVAGGDGGDILSSAELYDPSSDTWSTTGSLAQGRRDHTASVLRSGKVLVTGGDNVVGHLSSAELYDPSTGTWSTTGSLAQGRSFHTASVLNSGKVLVATAAQIAELYDPSTGTWSTTGSLAQTHDGGTATVLNNGKVLVAGGKPEETSAELYDPSTGTWSTTGSLALSRVHHTASLLSNGKVLVAGPGGGSTELYDPSTGTWSTTGSLAQGRIDHTATVLNNGKVLVAGGGNNDLSSAELYDPSTGTWSTTGSLAQGRSFHTATVLNNGKVLVAGGGNNDLSSAELYALVGNGGGCTLDNECASGPCVDGVCCDKACTEDGYGCAQARTGKADGICAPTRNGSSCSSDTECSSGHCADGVCCDAPCTSADHQCIQTRTGKPDGTCAPVMNGVSCSSPTECGSGHCADGVCCDTACDASCMACVNSLTGEQKGHCAPQKQGQDIRNECAVLGDGECKTSGVCDGTGVCESNAGQGCNQGNKACAADANSLVTAWACTIQGECQPSTETNCLPYKCANDTCLTQCTKEADCQDAYICVKGQCEKETDRGKPCTNESDCSNKHCVDGVCCDKACDGVCERCDGSNTVSGTPGVCSPMVAAADPDNECAKDDSNVCGLDGFCDGHGLCAKAPATKECGAVCDGNTTLTKRCDGTGTCQAVASTAKACTPYACSTVTGTCKSVCTADTDCASGAKCDVQSGQCAFNNATCADEYTLKDADGTEHDCTPYKCSGSTCRDSCTAPTDCAPGYDCTDSKCIKSSGNGTGGGATGDGGPAGPQETDVKEDNGCGCSVPGQRDSHKTPWSMFALALASWALARRRNRA